MIGVGEGKTKACGNKFLTVCLLFSENMTFYYDIVCYEVGQNKMFEESGPLKCIQPPLTVGSSWSLSSQPEKKIASEMQ